MQNIIGKLTNSETYKLNNYQSNNNKIHKKNNHSNQMKNVKKAK